MKTGHELWVIHPHVRTGSELSRGERAADKLKATFGSWAFLISLNALIVVWVAVNIVAYTLRWDPYPFILLNLGLSWLAAQQGGALQIAANRGDRIAAEIALSTHECANQTLQLQQQQMEILEGQNKILAALAVQPSPSDAPATVAASCEDTKSKTSRGRRRSTAAVE